MFLRLLMLFVVFAATGGRGKGSAKGGGKKKAVTGGKMKAFEVLQDDVQQIAAAAGTTLGGVLGEVPSTESMTNWQLARVTITPTAAVTGNSTNSGTINVRQLRGGAVIATVASLALVTGVNLAAEVPTVIPISGTPVLVAGDVLDVQYVQIGTGLLLPLSTVKAEIN